MLEKFNGFQIFIAAVFVGNPVSIFPAVIQIEHGGDGIHPQSVHVVFFHPVNGVGDEEIVYLIFTVIKYFRSPVRVFPFSGVSVLIEGFSVEFREAVGVPGKMGRHPVKNDADAFFMQVIDEIHEFLWRPVTGGRGKIARDLISPGAVVRMLRDAHQLDVGVSHIGYVIRQFLCSFHICIAAVFLRSVFPAPGSKVNLVNAYWRVQGIGAPPFFHPGIVTPLEAGDIGGDRSGSGPVFRAECIGIRLK